MMDKAGTAKLYIIAGEDSGDQLAGALLAALSQAAPHLTFSGIGGEHIQQHGIKSLFPMRDIAVMGFAEIIPHILRIKRRIRDAVQDIITQRPDILITVDAPGFCFRVIERLRRSMHKDAMPLCIHYVAQTVWAYKPHRAQKAASLLDGLLTLFAFEPPYFTAHGLKTYWVGHPAAWSIQPRSAENIIPGRIVAFAGSRAGELKRHIPLFRDVAQQLRTHRENLSFIMPLPQRLLTLATTLTADWPCPLIFCPAEERIDAMATAEVALCKSGTISLECALSNTPMVITYRAHPISAWIVRRTVRTRYVGLPNILLNREAVAEYIQEQATSEQVGAALQELMESPARKAEQCEAFTALRKVLLPSSEHSPSQLAAQHVLQMLATSQAERRAATSSS